MNVIKAKFSPFVINNHNIERTKLLNSMQEKSVVFIAAPTGYGKTSLLVQYCGAAKEKVMWYSVDQNDDVPITFIKYFFEGLIRCIFDDNKKRILPISEVTTNAYYTNLVASLLNYFQDSVKEPLTIIVDNFHYIRNENILEMWHMLMQYLPIHIKIILASRKKIEIETNDLLTSNRLLEINMEMLKFSEDEQALYLKQSKDVNYEFVEKNDGWPFGLSLLQNVPSSIYVSGTRIPDFYNRCFESILDLFEKKYFYIQIAILDIIDIDVCNYITGRKDSATLLKEGVEGGLFITKTVNGFYKYHDLFKEYLLNNMGDKTDLYVVLANYYMEKNNSCEAITYFLLGKEYQKVTALFKENSYKFISYEYISYLNRWEKEITIKDAKAYGPLALVNAYLALCDENIYLGKIFLEYAEEVFLYKDRDEEGLVRLILLRIKLFRLSKKIKKANELVNQIYEIMQAKSFEEKIDWLIEKFYISIYVKGVTQQLQELKRLTEDIDGKNMTQSQIRLFALYEYASYLVGDYKMAMQIHSENIYRVAFRDKVFYPLRIYVIWGRLEEGKRMVEIEIENALKYKLSDRLAELYYIMGDIEVHCGQYSTAERCYRKALSLYNKEGVNLRFLCYFSLAQILVFLEREQEGMAIIEAAYTEIPQKYIVLFMMVDVHLAQTYLIMGEYQKAIYYVEKSLPIAEFYGAKRCISSALAVLAVCCIQEGHTTKVYEYAKRSIQLAAQEDYIQDYITYYEVYSPMISFCKKNQLEKIFIYDKIETKVMTHHDVDLTLNVTYFGNNIVYVGDKLIRWRTIKARNIFFYLLYHKKTGVAREKLLDIYYWDYDLDKAKDNLKTVISYIRKAFRETGTQCNVDFINGRYFIRYKNINTDIEAFLNWEKNFEKGKVSVFEMAQNLCEIYKGGFCEDIDMGELMLEREKWFERFEKHIIKSIHMLITQSLVSQALVLVNVLMERDSYNEKYYNLKISIYQKMNNQNMVSKTKEELLKMQDNE